MLPASSVIWAGPVPLSGWMTMGAPMSAMPTWSWAYHTPSIGVVQISGNMVARLATPGTTPATLIVVPSGFWRMMPVSISMLSGVVTRTLMG